MINGFHYFEKSLVLVAGVAVVLILAITTLSVIGRYLLGAPIPDDVVMNEFLMVFVVFLPFAYVQSQREHIMVTLFTEKLSDRSNMILDAFGYLIGLVFFAIMTYSAFHYFLDAWITGNYMEGPLALPEWPVRFIFFTGILMFTLRFAIDFIKAGVDLAKRK
ncbi:MAG: TRAP transporter small permease [Sneathiella sp.]|nr:TRAP transporter small permease [Sneathiella sp.]